MNYRNKITIIGAGMVGGTTAYTLVVSNLAEEIALIDINEKLVKSQVMDLQHAVPFWGHSKIKCGTYGDVSDSKIIVICCGARQRIGKTASRLDLLKKNSAIIKGILPKIFRNNPDAVVLMVTNPVDILTCQAIRMFPEKKSQIIGSGTVLDSARFRFLLADYLEVSPRSIHAYIVGEHGDSEVPLWSTATIGNTNIDNFKKIPSAKKKEIFGEAKTAAYKIIEGKKATYFAIAAGVAKIVRSIILDRKTVLPLSHLMEGDYGIKGVCLSLPLVVGSRGVIRKVDLNISPKEKALLRKSAEKLKEAAEKS